MNNPITFQRVESAALFAAATFVYFHNHLSWIFYLLLLFSFDIFMIGYAVNNRVGAFMYNIGHSMIVPSVLIISYAVHPNRIILGCACLWVAHIGIDRALGYGLKLTSGFQHTHLGTIGK